MLRNKYYCEHNNLIGNALKRGFNDYQAQRSLSQRVKSHSKPNSPKIELGHL